MIRRFFFSLLWFAIFWVGIHVIGGGIAGAVAGGKASPPDATFEEGYNAGAKAGAAAGAQFRQRYAGFIYFGAAAAAVIGTATGALPGTREKKDVFR